MKQQTQGVLIRREEIRMLGGLCGLILAMGLLERLIEIGRENSPPAWNAMTLAYYAGFVGIASLLLGMIFYGSKWAEHKGMTAAFSAGGAVVLCFLCSGWRILEDGKTMISLIALLGSGLVFFALVFWIEGIGSKHGEMREKPLYGLSAESCFPKVFEGKGGAVLSGAGLLFCALLMAVVFWGLPLRSRASGFYQHRAAWYPIFFLAFFFAWNIFLQGFLTALKKEKPHDGMAVLSGTAVLLAAFLVGIFYGLSVMRRDGLFGPEGSESLPASMLRQFLNTFLPFLQYLIFSAGAFYLWQNRRKKQKGVFIRKELGEPSGI